MSEGGFCRKKRRAIRDAKPTQEPKELIRIFMEDDKALREKVASLEMEISDLRQRNEQLKRALIALI